MSESKARSEPAWLLLITNLSGKNQTLRMRLWRALKSAGAALLRDGVYVLPQSVQARRLFDEQAQEIIAAGGTSYVVTMSADGAEQQDTLQRLFDRTGDYAEALSQLETLLRDFPKLSETQARQRLAGARRDVSALIDQDFFPGKAREQMVDALSSAEAALNRLFSPDEPSAGHQGVERRDAKAYQGRTWATREHLWIDRVASAWLIRRFIDPKARFAWLKRTKDLPKKAVGFDFDGAEFTHIGARVTFEVLVASFGLEADPALTRVGALIHFLDVGGVPVAEAPGFASIMAGARSIHAGDDTLLEAMRPVLDSLYASYSAGDTA